MEMFENDLCPPTKGQVTLVIIMSSSSMAKADESFAKIPQGMDEKEAGPQNTRRV